MTARATAAVPRDSRGSTRSTYDVDVSDELSSWLGDDVCANCGATAQPNHLYCSQECKDEDAKHIDQGKSTLAPKPTPALSSATRASSAPFWTESNDNSNKFRYPCPTSPSIVPKYNSALTSPALVALERSLPNTAPASTTGRGSHSISSSGLRSDAAALDRRFPRPRMLFRRSKARLSPIPRPFKTMKMLWMTFISHRQSVLPQFCSAQRPEEQRWLRLLRPASPRMGPIAAQCPESLLPLINTSSPTKHNKRPTRQAITQSPLLADRAQQIYLRCWHWHLLCLGLS
jgi:hypothetical protein